MPLTLTTKLREKARELGIDALGIIPASSFQRLASLLEKRTLSPWAPQDRNAAIDPSLVLPKAQSIICTAISYNNEIGNSTGPRIARYARVQDYHRVFTGKLNQLGQYLQELTGAQFRVCVDTGPLFDREAAYLAGIGFYGKNNCIIHPELGSWVFLGEIVTTYPLPATGVSPLVSACGDCQRCLQACPTQALGPYRLDYTKCLSYLTQSKEFIPLDLWPQYENTLYGCDRCQEVCPKNRRVPVNCHWEFAPLAPFTQPMDLARLLELSNRDFREIFGATPMGWAGKAVLQRNAVIVLANEGTPPAKDLIVQAAKSTSPLVRSHAEAYLAHH